MTEPKYVKVNQTTAIKTTEINEEIYKEKLLKRKVALQAEIAEIDDILKVWK